MEETKLATESPTVTRINNLLNHLIQTNSKSINLLHQCKLAGKEMKNGMMVIIGGMVLDIHATTCVTSTSHSTTPGKVDYMLGGVARNIAECLIKLGTKLFMISAIGDDMAGDRLLELWKSAALPIEGIQRSVDIKTAVVCNMFDVNGELTAGVASVESIERFVTPQWIQQFKSIARSAPVMLVDANLSPASLEASCQLAADLGVPVWFEPVSVTKSKRIASIVNSVTFASPNEHELVAMANALSYGAPYAPIKVHQNRRDGSIESMFLGMRSAILALLDKGIKFVLVTVGPSGAFLCSKGWPSCVKVHLRTTQPAYGNKELFHMINSKCPSYIYTDSAPVEGDAGLFVMHFPALPAMVGRVSGAGDCLVGGALASLCSGLNVVQSVAVGIAAAKAAIEVETNVPHRFDLTTIAEDAGVVYHAAKVLFKESKM